MNWVVSVCSFGDFLVDQFGSGCDAEGAAHGFAHFWLTDSCASTVKDVRGVEPFEVLSLAGSIAVALHI